MKMAIEKKKKHVSKKNKKDWRKHCDIRDVEEFLEDQRLEERLGKFDSKPDSELFVVDTAGNDVETEGKTKPLSAKLKKRQKLAEGPKCFEILIPDSKVQDPNAKRNHVNPVGFKPTSLSKLTDKRRMEKGVYQRKVDQARTNRQIARDKKRKNKQVRQTFDTDLWDVDSKWATDEGDAEDQRATYLLMAAPEAKGIPATLIDEFVSTEAQIHNVLPERRIRPRPPGPETLARAAVETPHPGVSYNPTFQEHQELLQDVVVHEQKMMSKQARLYRLTTGMFSKVTAAEREDQWREEMSVGLPTPHNPAVDPEPESDNEYKPINPPVKNKKKDHKARRKQKEQLAEKERLKRKKIDKKKISDIYKLRKLQSSIKTREQKQAMLRTKRKEKQAIAAATAVPALNKNKTPVKEPDFVDPATLSGDLRHINASSNLLRDRFESLQRRGALAASKIMMKKKRKVKSYFKQGHKVTDQDIQRYVNRTTGAGQK